MIRQTRQYFVLFITLVLVAGAFSGYFLVYLPQKKQQIDERNFRVLSKISENALSKANGLSVNAHYNAKNALEEFWWEEVTSENGIDNVVVSPSLGELNKKLNEKIFNREIRIDQLLPVAFTPIPDKEIGGFKLVEERNEFRLTYLDTIKHFGSSPKLNELLVEEKTHYQFKFSFALESFFESIIRPEFFQEYFVVKGDEIIYSSFSSGLTITQSDSLLGGKKALGGIETSGLRDLEMAGIPYKMFMQPLSISSEDWILCGLIPLDKYKSEKYSVSSYTIFMASLLLILGLLALPFLKLSIMSRDERLRKSDAALSAGSIIFITAVISILFLHSHTFLEREHHHWDAEYNLESISDDLSKNLESELRRVIGQIRVFEPFLTKLDQVITNDSSYVSKSPLDAVNVNNPSRAKMDAYAEAKIKYLFNKNNDVFIAYRKKNFEDQIKQTKSRISQLEKQIEETDSIIELTPVTVDTVASLQTVLAKQTAKLDTALKKLKEFEDELKDIGTEKNKKLELDKGLDRIQANLQSASEITLKMYPYFNNISWIDDNGDQIYKWAASDKISAHVNVSGRNYFQEIKNDRGWHVDRISKSPFYLESIIALNTGRQEAAVSSVIDNERLKTSAHVAAITTRLSSIMDPILPVGYGFCVIDEHGEVMFHSNKSRNLQENLLEETNGNRNLESAIYSRTSKHFSASYHGKKHDMHIKSLWSTPLYLVTFADPSIIETAHTQVLSYTLLMYLGFFCLILFQLAVVLISQYSSTRLHSSKYSFDWLWPSNSKVQRYATAAIAYLVLIVNLYATEFNTLPSEKIYAILFSAFYSVLIGYYIINGEAIRQKKTWVIILFTLTPVVVFGVISAQVISVLFDGQMGRHFVFLIVPSLLIIASIAHILFGKTSRNWLSIMGLDRMKNLKLTLNSTYLPLIAMWLFLGVVLPIHFFFAIGYNQESTIKIKHRQIEYSKAIKDREFRLKQDFANVHLDSTSLFELRHASQIDLVTLPQDRVIYKNLLVDSETLCASDFSSSDLRFQSHYNRLRASYSKHAMLTNDLVYDSSNPKNTWNYCSSSIHFQSLSETGNTFEIESVVHPFHLPTINLSGSGIAFWSLVLLTIVFLLVVIRFVMHRLFAFSPIGSEYEPHILNKVDLATESFERVFCISLPYSGLDDKLVERDDWQIFDLREKLQVEDFEAEIEAVISSNPKLLIVKRFEFLIEDAEANAKKLNLLEQIISKTQIRLTVVSTVATSQLFDQYTAEDNAVVARWSRILSGFKNVYWPIEKATVLPIPKSTASQDVIKAQILVNQECRHSTYLQSLIAQIYIDVESWPSPVNSDDVILHVQSLSTNYYHSLWASCSDREKLLIYDLAEDGFVNEKNAQTIEGLLGTGILVVERGKLRLLNRSFKNFVLTVVERDTALKAEMESANKGSWNSFRGPLMVILVALAAFILISQQGSFNNIVSFIASLSAALMTGFRLFESFNTLRGKSSGS